MLNRIVELLQPDVSTEAKLTALVLLLGKKIESQQSEIADLQARQLQKGDKGDTGPQGPKGEKGERGSNGEPGIPGARGTDGKAGKNGQDGADGRDGVSVVDADVDLDGHLVFKLSDGSLIDAGVMPEVSGNTTQLAVSGNAWQIAVSSTAPSAPQLNDLWLQI